MINLDRNAAYGAVPSALARVNEVGSRALNPMSIHQGGQRARALIEETRERFGRLVGLRRGGRVVFTSGATEANNWALLSLVLPLLGRGGAARSGVDDGDEPPSFVTTAVEHPSVLEAAGRLERLGVRCEIVSPRADGSIRSKDVLERCDPSTRLVSVMLANNETGALYPVDRIAREVRERSPRALVHSDAVQALGKIPVAFSDLGIDIASFSAHKIGGLPGVGALVVRDSALVGPLLLGGPQEGGLRAGTENVHGIAAFGGALEELEERFEERTRRMAEGAARLQSELTRRIEGVRVNFSEIPRLPNTVSVSVEGVAADDLVVALDLEGVCVSSGAACAAGKPDPSHVLLAHGFSEEEARSTLRMSVGGDETDEEIERAIAAAVGAVKRMRRG